MRVKFAMLGQSTREVDVKEPASVEDVLKAANVTLKEDKEKNLKDEALLNGEKVTDLKTRIAPGAVVTVVPRVKGGR